MFTVRVGLLFQEDLQAFRQDEIYIKSSWCANNSDEVLVAEKIHEIRRKRSYTVKKKKEKKKKRSTPCYKYSILYL